MFDAYTNRPNARNVLVLFIDKQSSTSPGDIIRAARPLEEDRVKVIPVAIGNEVNLGELDHVTPEKGNLITGRNDEDPGRFGDRIMHKVFKSRDYLFFFFIWFYCFVCFVLFCVLLNCTLSSGLHSFRH